MKIEHNLDNHIKIIQGDSWELAANLQPNTIQTIITSPPYWGLRDYEAEGQFGHEDNPLMYVQKLVDLFDRLEPALKENGTIWLNIGDSYASYRDGKVTPDSSRKGNQGTSVPKGKAKNRMAQTFKNTPIKHKDLVGIPWRVAFALQEAGWYLRQDIIWNKPNPMPESVKDRCTKSHEYVFLLSKSPKYYYNHEAIKENTTHESNKQNQTRNKRDVWTIPTKPFKDAHFAVMPRQLAELCLLAATQENDTVLDPFSGSGTTLEVARFHNRNAIGFEINPNYIDIALNNRLRGGMIL